MNDKTIKGVILTLSIAIPLVVVLLFRVKIEGVDLTFLPPIYAAINALTGILLIAAIIAIKNKRRQLHERIMKFNLLLSATFLIMYVLYHMTSDSTSYQNEGAIAYFYYFILVSHIVLSVAVVPLVLLTFSKALLKNFEAHKKIARVAFPMWLYVSISGVIVYIMISPFYT